MHHSRVHFHHGCMNHWLILFSEDNYLILLGQPLQKFLQPWSQDYLLALAEDIVRFDDRAI